MTRNAASTALSVTSSKSEADLTLWRCNHCQSPAADHGCHVILGGAKQELGTSPRGISWIGQVIPYKGKSQGQVSTVVDRDVLP